jgi:hypothetical protein
MTGAHSAEPTPAAPIPNLVASVSVDITDPGNPLVILRLNNGGIAAEFRIDARKAGQFGMSVGQGLVQAGHQALAAAGPQLVTPTPPNTLLIARPGTPPNGNGPRP